MLLVPKLDLFIIGTIILPELKILAVVVANVKIGIDAKIDTNAKIGIDAKISIDPKISINIKINSDMKIKSRNQFFISPTHIKRNFGRHYANTNQSVGHEHSKMEFIKRGPNLPTKFGYS
jgi:UDP-3-O-[3-hydroxymyristoyl] glucosamine N-acyltransferase